MKVTFPLSLKVSLWLLVNLAVLLAAAGTFVSLNYGVGWTAFFAGPAGARAQVAAKLVAADLRSNPEQSIEPLLARYAPEGRAQLLLFLNDGRQLGGPSTPLPESIRAALTEGPPRDEPPEGRRRGFRRGPPPFDEQRPPPDRPPDGLPPGRRPPVGFVLRDGSPASYWIGIRMPVARRDEPMPAHGTLVIHTRSVLGLLQLLNFGPWLAAAGMAFLLSVLCWLPFVSGLRRALLGVTHATERIAEGQFETRVSTARRDELGALGHAVNQMAGRLEAHVQAQKRFLGDVAHELGTPLSRLQVAVELLERQAFPTLHAQIADVREEVELVSSLVNELLAFTKAGLRRREAALAPVAVAELVHAVLTREDPASHVRPDIAPGATALADPALLERALSNLVRNALRYASDSEIVVSAQPEGTELVLRVVDAGPGVSDDALSRLGEPFFRPDMARTRESGGTGLGLAIVRTCVEASRGTVSFHRTVPQGFTAEMRFARPA